MRTLHVKLSILGACLTLLLAASTSFAQVYRWVDADGKTHYSERKEVADTAKPDEMKLRPESVSPEQAKASEKFWQEQNTQAQQRLAQKQKERPYLPPMATAPQPNSGGRSDGSDAQRCALARDVLSGAVKLRNGLPTGAIEREIAQNDVRAACK